MRKCEICSENSWSFKYEANDNSGMIYALCDNCGHEISFKARERKRVIPQKGVKAKEQTKAEYKIIDGKRFLKILGEYKEVELKKFFDKNGRSFLKVREV